MDENINESVEIQEVAEPETEALESEETQEVAEPAEAEDSAKEEESSESEDSSGKNDQDAAFAKMRREIAQLKKDNEMMSGALGRFFDGESAEELSINANAYAEQKDPEEYRQEWERDQELSNLQSENDDLREQLLSAQVEKVMREDLAVIQEIDPTVKSLDELGESFLKMRLNPEAPLSAVDAFYACRAKEMHEKVLAPDAIGRVTDTRVERDYFTSEEIDHLTDEELDDPVIWEKVMKSLGKL